MAYKNLVSVECVSRTELFKRFRDFVCKRNGSYDYSAAGIGWTLHDAVYAVDEDTISTNDYFVIYSPGENGNEDLYFKCSFLASSIQLIGYLYWNASTHAGVQAYNGNFNWPIDDAMVPVLWAYGDLNAIFAIARASTVASEFYGMPIGKGAHPVLGEDIVSSAGALTSGADKVIDVGTVPASWQVGQKIFIRDNANVDRITISAMTGSTITATLARAYDAGAKLSAYVGYYCTGGDQLTSQFYWLIDGDGNKNTNSGGWKSDATLVTYGNPDPLTGKYLMTPLYTGGTSMGLMGFMRDVYRRPDGVTALDVHVVAGVSYRAFLLYSNMAIMVKEV